MWDSEADWQEDEEVEHREEATPARIQPSGPESLAPPAKRAKTETMELREQNEELRKQKEELRKQKEELREQVEMYKGQVEDLMAYIDKTGVGLGTPDLLTGPWEDAPPNIRKLLHARPEAARAYSHALRTAIGGESHRVQLDWNMKYPGVTSDILCFDLLEFLPKIKVLSEMPGPPEPLELLDRWEHERIEFHAPPNGLDHAYGVLMMLKEELYCGYLDDPAGFCGAHRKDETAPVDELMAELIERRGKTWPGLSSLATDEWWNEVHSELKSLEKERRRLARRGITPWFPRAGEVLKRIVDYKDFVKERLEDL
jgi:hypothetical protein